MPSGVLAIAALLASPAPAELNVRADLDLGRLARCLERSGTTFYGAHWCPVCRKQMATFGEHASALPYVECYDGARSDGMNGTCRSADVRAFPTWVFPDGRAKTGALSPLALAAASDCLGL